jgi:hypothetical protein
MSSRRIIPSSGTYRSSNNNEFEARFLKIDFVENIHV